MTKEEAIKIINCYDIGFYDLSGEKIPADKLAEAFDMAIEALQRTSNAHPTHECVEKQVTGKLINVEIPTKRESEEAEKQVKGDLISRQAAIDAIEHVTWYHQNRNGQMVSGANSDEHQAWYKAEDVYEAIEAVECAEPKTGEWIEHEHGFWTFVNDKGERDGWIPDYECNLCGARAWRVKTPFCPTCGARMKGADDE